MPRKVRSPKQTSPNTFALLETCSEPDLSPAASAVAADADASTRKSSKRLRGDDSYTTPDRIGELRELLESWKADQDIVLGKLVAQVTELKQQNLSIQRTNLELERSVQFLSSSFENMKTRLETLEDENREFKRRLQEEVGSQRTIGALVGKIDSMEQHARQCNIEICNLPEKRNENLNLIVETIGHVVNWPVSHDDIVSIHRVPHAQQQDKKPKNVIVEFKRRITRDNLLSAYRKVKSIKTDQLGISGASVSVYLNEHLTLKYKSLFREAKKVASKNGFKYVWIRNATILVRERDGSSAYAIRSEEDLKKIVPGDK
ncbi:uncharacterized protein LOC111353279 [Spodoptera litura]|uniref:Uncharacterized protein LOC111353279 n=1 Tax=Spodoptera litura TaxID=69820 RepID=A0A9J7E4Y2_SPOLT|nr:uncharacterized protein LOC111353279 [Spodoptera litura]